MDAQYAERWVENFTVMIHRASNESDHGTTPAPTLLSITPGLYDSYGNKRWTSIEEGSINGVHLAVHIEQPQRRHSDSTKDFIPHGISCHFGLHSTSSVEGSFISSLLVLNPPTLNRRDIELTVR